MIRTNFLRALLSISLIIVSYSTIFSCTNYLVTRGASVNGSTMITYAADSHELYGELYFSNDGYIYAIEQSLDEGLVSIGKYGLGAALR